MKVYELKEILEHLSDDDNIVVLDSKERVKNVVAAEVIVTFKDGSFQPLEVCSDEDLKKMENNDQSIDTAVCLFQEI